MAVERTGYRPYGEEVAVQQPLTLPETKGFIGERFDGDAGLQYLNARYYDPRLGMFVQPDWWEVTQAGVGTNRYSYSGGDPVNARDPGGNDLLLTDPLAHRNRRGIQFTQPFGGGGFPSLGSGSVAPSPNAIRAAKKLLEKLRGPASTLSPAPMVDHVPTKSVASPARSSGGLQGLAPGSGSIVFSEPTEDEENLPKPGDLVVKDGKIFEVDENGELQDKDIDIDGLRGELGAASEYNPRRPGVGPDWPGTAGSEEGGPNSPHDRTTLREIIARIGRAIADALNGSDG